MRTVALVGMTGSIDWYCYPTVWTRPAFSERILDDKKGGDSKSPPALDGVRHKQVYWSSTNVLVTRFFLRDGIAELEDFHASGFTLRIAGGTVKVKDEVKIEFDIVPVQLPIVLGPTGLSTA